MSTLPRLRLLFEVLLVLTCSALYAWGTRQQASCARVDVATQAQMQQAATAHDVRVVTRTVTKPDGTKSVTQTRERLTVQETEHVQTQTETRAAVPTLGLTRYSFGLVWQPLRLSPTPWMPAAASVGARLGNLPVWLEVGLHREPLGPVTPTLGVRYEF